LPQGAVDHRPFHRLVDPTYLDSQPLADVDEGGVRLGQMASEQDRELRMLSIWGIWDNVI
jgi:hypothetical protein